MNERRDETADGDGPRSVGIVTDEEHADLAADGRAIASELETRGFRTEPLVWTKSADPERYDVVLFRTPWDYYTVPDRFQSFLDRLNAAGIEVYNPIDVVRWNIHKSYLTELAGAGVETTPTVCFESGEDVSLEAVLAERGWEQAVIKPAIGAGSEGVWRTSLAEAAADQRRFEDDLSERDTLVQQFLPGIDSGERSIVFVDGAYSHAWNDVPRSDDFSAFAETGVTFDPPASARSAAYDTLATACRLLGYEPTDLPYARVDYVDDDGFSLIELELFEPNLELGVAPEAAERVAESIASRLR